MRISDWSSDVCSSDLPGFPDTHVENPGCQHHHHAGGPQFLPVVRKNLYPQVLRTAAYVQDRSHADQRPDPRLVHEPDISGSRSEEHTSELQSLMRIAYAVFCLKKKQNITYNT